MRYSIVLLSFVYVFFPAHRAPAQIAPLAGVDYTVLETPQPTPSSGKIEVTEFFWYRCPHCYALEPLLDKWIARLPENTHFDRVPAVFGDEWMNDAKIFYALEAIGERKRLHARLLKAVHEEGGKGLHGDDYLEWVSDWLEGQGVDVRRYRDAMRSGAVRAQVKAAADMTRAYGVSGTPNMAVGGRYLVTPLPGDRRRILQVTDFVIRLASDVRSTGGQEASHAAGRGW